MMKPQLTFMTGFCPVIHARQGRMLGSRNPLDGSVFDRLQNAIHYSIGVMAGHQGCSVCRPGSRGAIIHKLS